MGGREGGREGGRDCCGRVELEDLNYTDGKSCSATQRLPSEGCRANVWPESLSTKSPSKSLTNLGTIRPVISLDL